MAGSCVDQGIGIDGDGNVILSGATSKEWPNEAGCPIASNNGLHFDPVTGHAWIPPRVAPHYEVVIEEGTTITPADDDTVDLGTFELEHTVGPCGQRRVIIEIGGGYNAYRLYSGNFWLLKRYATLFVDGTPESFTGLEIVTACENNSGGAVSQAGPIEMTPFSWVLDPGQTVKVVTSYQLEFPGFTANAVNSFVFRPPPIRATFLPIPT